MSNHERFIAALNGRTQKNGGMNKDEIKMELIKRFPTFKSYIGSLEKRRHLVRFWDERQDVEEQLEDYDDVKSFVSEAPILRNVNDKWISSMMKKYLITIHDNGNYLSIMRREWDINNDDPVRDIDNVVKQFQKTIFRANGTWKPYGGDKQHDMLHDIICNSKVASYHRMMIQLRGIRELRSFAKKLAAAQEIIPYISINVHFQTNIISVLYYSKSVCRQLQQFIANNGGVVPMTNPPDKYWYRHRNSYIWSTNGPPDSVKKCYEQWLDKYNVTNKLFNKPMTRVSCTKK